MASAKSPRGKKKGKKKMTIGLTDESGQAGTVKKARTPRSRRKSSSKIADTIKVAVRVRPFNARERKKGCKTVVAMTGNTCILADGEKDKSKSFKFDYCYWSFSKGHPNFTNQATVFNDLGHLYVNNAFDGYNSSVFAYGQTGSGKTYTMLGSSKNPGLIPRGCEELFRRIIEEYAPRGINVEVESSYLEVYMDRIYDLLAKPDKKSSKQKRGTARQKLPIRFHPKRGAYVEGLTRHAVGSYRDVQKLMNVGLANRTVAETEMNKISSRSHCIFTLFLNVYNDNGEIRTSKINLIDLAGSERVAKTGVTGERMDELKKINKSLSALGDVIGALSHGAKFVPYNNSVLTTLLRESLGGNSKTIMMATISAADDNFEESMSTLRYASRVKKIKTFARKNIEESKAAVESELRAEIERLKRKLELSGGKGNMGGVELQMEAASENLRRIQMEQAEKIREMHKAYELMANRLASMGLSVNDEKSQQTAPKLMNLSADPSLTGQMVFFLTKTKIRIGNDKAAFKPEILLTASDTAIQPHHATIRVNRMKVDIHKKAKEARKQVWKLLFEECDLNSDGFLDLIEFNNWSSQVLQHSDHFQGFTRDEFDKLCVDHGENSSKGLTFKSIFSAFGETSSKKVPMNCAQICRIPRSKMNAKLIKDIKDFVLDDHNLISITPNDKIIDVVFEYDLSDSDLVTIEGELKDLLTQTKYGSGIVLRRPDDALEEFVEELKLTIESADPSNEHLMIFVNGERVRFDPVVITHGDHILLGSRHLFQLIIPEQAMAKSMGKGTNAKSPSAGGGSGKTRKGKKANANSDMEEMQRVISEERSRPRVGTITDFKELIRERMKNPVFRISNIDVLSLKEQILSNRQLQGQTGGDSSTKMMRVHDQFMQDYRILSQKCSHANSMSMELDKSVLFSVNTLTFFDINQNAKSDRIVIIRECQLSDPELQLQMIPAQFESMLKDLSHFYELSRQDGEEIAIETMDDDPFIPGNIDSVWGESRFKLTGRKVQKDPYIVPILRSGSDKKVGEITIEATFKLAKKGTNCYDFKKMENKKVTMTLDIMSVVLESWEARYVFITFCGAGPEVLTFRCDADPDDGGFKTREFEFSEAYEVNDLTITPAFRNFLGGTGIVFKVWVPVFDDPDDMPPVIAYKMSSVKVNLSIKKPDGETMSITAQTGNSIMALKRKLDFLTNYADDDQTLIFDKTTLENHRSLMDYGIEDGSVIIMMVNTKRRMSVDDSALDSLNELQETPPLGDDYKMSSEEKEVDDHLVRTMSQMQKKAIEKELANPELSDAERKKLRRAKNRSIHIAMIETEMTTPTTMTEEGYRAENIKLKDALRKAQVRISELERELAIYRTKVNGVGGGQGDGKKRGKFFGGWGSRRSSKRSGK